MSERTSDLLTGLFIGSLVGAVLGVLFAPKSGKRPGKIWPAKRMNF